MQKTKEIIKKVKKFEIKTKNLVDGLIQGTYHSVFRGRGIEFDEVREYSYGDDIRTIDWNVTARMNEPYVKEFIEERDITVYILFDISSSGRFGSKKQKKESAIEIVASLMFAASRNSDRVGLALFSDKLEKFIPARRGRRHVLKIIRELLYFEPDSGLTDIDKSLKYISKIIKKRSIIFIISDFMSPDFSSSLKLLKKKNDVIAVNIRDIREEEIPDVGYIMLEDEETGEQLVVNTSSPEFRKEYERNVNKSIKALESNLRKCKVDIIHIKSDEDFEVPIRKFFKLRMRRISR